MKTKLYILISSEDSANIRYFGRTIKTLQHRLKQHINGSRYFTIDINNVTLFVEDGHKARWIRKVLSNGFKVEIIFIGEIEGDGKVEEIAYIKYLREEGFDLVNDTDGGVGTIGYKHTQKTREKMCNSQNLPEVKKKKSDSMSKYYESSEAVEQASIAANKRWEDPEARKQMSITVSGENNHNYGKEGYWKGKHLSIQHRENVRKARTGTHQSPETKEKSRITALLRAKRNREEKLLYSIIDLLYTIPLLTIKSQ
jgi:hypothetical protein